MYSTYPTNASLRLLTACDEEVIEQVAAELEVAGIAIIIAAVIRPASGYQPCRCAQEHALTALSAQYQALRLNPNTHTYSKGDLVVFVQCKGVALADATDTAQELWKRLGEDQNMPPSILIGFGVAPSTTETAEQAVPDALAGAFQSVAQKGRPVVVEPASGNRRP